jgi:hypothetical protein
MSIEALGKRCVPCVALIDEDKLKDEVRSQRKKLFERAGLA